jgi:secreted PhoX family phosphatase
MRELKRRQLLESGSALATLLATGTAQAAAPSGLARDPHGMLDLPAGFTYRVVSRMGERMSDGYRVPGAPDAMGCFSTPAGLVLMRNHEVPPGWVDGGPYPPGVPVPSQAYDPAGQGGVTKLVFDPHTLALRSTSLALCGTHWNCAGGLSPWGWLSCEETFEPRHGYVFLCPVDAQQLTAARSIPAYGRFRHEAATVDPRTHIAYLTEDREDAAFYRFLPARPSEPFVGRLQALRVLDRPALDTSKLRTREELRVDWVDVSNPDPAQDDVRLQARERGAASFARTEGMWLAGDELFMSATVGGPIGRGQIFRVRLTDAPTLSVIAQSSDSNVLDMPDNLTVSPHGELYVAEDGLEGNSLRRVTPQGEVYEFARNAHSAGEFAGPCFAPDGQTLFVNLQREGLTFAIRGPFAELRGPTRVRATRAPLAGVAGLGLGVSVMAFAALAHRKRRAL